MVGDSLKLTERIKNIFTLETSENNITEEDFAEWLGVRYKSKSELREITYYTCLKMMSETMGKLPFKYYQMTERGKTRADPDRVSKLFTERPNKLMTPSIFMATMENNRNHYGNGYAWIRRLVTKQKTEVVLDVWPMQGNKVKVLMDDKGVFGDKGNLYYQYNDPKTGDMYVFKSENVIHVKTSTTFDGYSGAAVKDILKESVKGALRSQEYMNNLYEGGLTASMALQYTGDIDERLIKKLRNKYDKYLSGPKNAGKIVPVPIGMQLQPLNYKLTDAQFFELKKYNALQIAGAFGIKPNQINNYEKSSYANSEMQQLSFLVDTMLFPLKQYEEEINYKISTADMRNNNKYLKINEKAILRTDAKSQMQQLKDGVATGITLINEARDMLDQPYVEGGDVPIVNGTYIPLTMVGQQYKKGE